ncbi:proline dehydrogenase family protein [[Pseudopropionibacterium] massiliense]|uniref:proline dehydrogenase family protein n=1 Tax=[Pseudopropionibacterium] massiliense TaxID=2220000 RepID=UPI0010316ABE|nr:proline dehydrogenase family protein [[Pseudopropionibacterium] massiliense]
MRRSGDWIRWLVLGSWVARRAARDPGVWDLASNYVAGREVGAAVETGVKLRRQGLKLGFSYLSGHEPGEDTHAVISELLERLQDISEGSEVAVKPSALGMKGSRRQARKALAELCETVESRGAHATLEMQWPADYDDVMELYRTVREDHPMLGITLPANLLRVETECRRLGAEGARVRLCVGSYPAGHALAHITEQDKALALVRCLRILMESRAYPMPATHDPRIIELAQELARRNGRGPETFEYQMFHGVRPLEQRRLADIGLRCRTYIPFGPGWYGYLATRMAARPRILFSYARALLDKR